jgi:predicted nucleotidyltransferase
MRPFFFAMFTLWIMRRDEALQKQAAHAEELRRDFSVAHIDIFGSVARDEASPESDIDILVEFIPDARIGLFEFTGLKLHLEEYMGLKVDLATPQALKKQLKASSPDEVKRNPGKQNHPPGFHYVASGLHRINDRRPWMVLYRRTASSPDEVKRNPGKQNHHPRIPLCCIRATQN